MTIREKMEEANRLQQKEKIDLLLLKRFQTTYVGSLAIFEEIFGDLWKPTEGKDVTEGHILNKKDWKEARERILDLGNKQLRSAIKDLKQILNGEEIYRTREILRTKGTGDVNRGNS